MKRFMALLLGFILFTSYGPPNCNLYKDNPPCYEACREAEKAIMHRQGTKASQEHFDQSIALCPTFDYSYYEKAVPYAKRGLIKEWKVLIDKAVELNPKEYLSNRGWYHYYFMHNYEAAIQDIERLDELVSYDIGYTGDAIYHLNILKALCWKGLGDSAKALEIFLTQLQKEDHDTGQYDYLHLGVLYMENGKYDLAMESFDQQVTADDVSEIYYYKALVHEKLGQADQYQSSLERALQYYDEDKTMQNSYRQLPDEIYRTDILGKMNKEEE